jgi:predicted outer membrane protein
VHPNDISLLANGYQHSLFVVKVSDEAKTRSTYAETKEFADELIKTSEKIMSSINVISGMKEIEVPLDITQKHLVKWQNLVKSKGGWSFDNEFLNIVIKLKNEQQFHINQLAAKAENKEIRDVGINLKGLVVPEKDILTRIAKLKNSRLQKDSVISEVALKE